MFDSENSGGMFLFFIGLIIVFAILFNGGGGLFGGGKGGEDYVTKSDLCNSFNFNNLDNGVARLGQGLCDSTYALNDALKNGFHGTDMGLCGVNHNIDQCLMNLKTA